MIIYKAKHNVAKVMLPVDSPPDESTIKECGLNLTSNRHLSSDIDQWNADLAQFCMKREWGFVAMDHEFNPKDILSGSIDLNNTAKKHLAELIKQKVH